MVALTDAAVSPLVMARLPSVPMVVMLGWLAVCSVPVMDVAVRVVSPMMVPPLSLMDLLAPNVNKVPDISRVIPNWSVVMVELLVPSVIDMINGEDIDVVSISMMDAGLLTPMPRGAVVSNLDSVPVLVMLSWIVVCRVPVKVVALTDAAVSPLVMARLQRVPTDVMLGWLAVCSVPVRVVALTDAAVSPLVMARLPRVPTDVMLG